MLEFKVLQELELNNEILEVIKNYTNYGEHLHLFTGIVKCPDCGKIMSFTNSFKNSGTPKKSILSCNL